MADGLCWVPKMAVEGAILSVWSVRIAVARSAPVVEGLATVVRDEDPRESTGVRAGVSTDGRACVSTDARAGVAAAGRGVEMVAEVTPREPASGRARTPGDRVTSMTPVAVGAKLRM